MLRIRNDWTAFIRHIDQTYPFFDLKGIRAEWEKTKACLSRKIPLCATDSAFWGLVFKACRCLRDAHLNLICAKAPLLTISEKYYPGISFMPADGNRVIVLWASPQYGKTLKPGTTVSHIDGRVARDLLDQHGADAWSNANPYYVSSPQRARLLAYRLPLIGKKSQRHSLRILVQGRASVLQVVHNIEARGWPHIYNPPANLTGMGFGLSCCQLPSGAGYMHLRTVKRPTFTSMRRALRGCPGAKGWIIDLRGNGGGGYDQNLIAQIKRIPKPVIVVIDAGCMSAGETLARDLARYSQALLIGSRTAGASRERGLWQFPSGIATFSFSTRSHWRTDGLPIEYYGIEPDVELEPVAEEVMKGDNSEILRAEEYCTLATKGWDVRVGH